MNGEDAFYWYKLFRLENIGNKSIHIVYDQTLKYGIPIKKLFSMSHYEFETYLAKAIKENRRCKIAYGAFRDLDDEKIYKEYKELIDKNIKLIYLAHKDYPKRLLSYKNYYPPAVLFCEGNIRLANAKSIAIVGSRNASEEGLKISRWLSSQLAKEGINIISGYAKGIDTEAHIGALEVDGTTTIVLSYGVLAFKKKVVFDEIKWKNNYLVISEFPPEATWKKQNAMIRNKLVCALSTGVVVIESELERTEEGRKSGTYDAAKAALNMGVPLYIISPKEFKKPPRGNAELIKCGGIEVSRADVVEKISRRKDDKFDENDITNKKEEKNQLGLFEE